MPATLVTPPPYKPRVPALSNCKTFQATDLFEFTSTVSFFYIFLLKFHSLCYYHVLFISIHFYPRPHRQPQLQVPDHPIQVARAPALGAVLLQQARIHNLQLLAR